MKTEEQRQDLKRILAFFGVIGVGILGWAGAQFAPLPAEVSVLKAQRVEDKAHLDKMDDKLDKILLAVKRH